MKRALLVCLGLVGAGCVHAQQTESQADREEQQGPEAKGKDTPAKPPGDGKPRSGGAHTRPNEAITTSRTTQKMFKKEGLEKLQRALVDKKLPEVKVQPNGLLDSATQDALRAFQKQEELPDTGLPDFETVRRLGLEPSDVYQERPPAAEPGGVQ